MSDSTLASYAHALRHVKLSQLRWRVRERLFRAACRMLGAGAGRLAWPGSPPALRLDPEVQSAAKELAEQRLKRRPRAWSAETPEQISFLGEARTLGFPPKWRGAGARDARLWEFHLHELGWIWDVLAEAGPEQARDVLCDWEWRNAIGSAGAFHAAWHPYTVSKRLVNLLLLLAEGTITEDAYRDTLWRHAAYLSRHLEWDLEGNHLLENIVALKACALLTGWEFAPLEIDTLLREQLTAQLLPNGCHFERCAMYHLRVLALLRELAALPGGHQPLVLAAVRRMERFARHLTKPNGALPLLGDGVADEVAMPTPANEEAGWRSFDGHVVWSNPEHGDWLLLDAAPLGPDENPGHAHADLGAVEIVFGGKPLVSAGGAGVYRECPERSNARSGAQHAVFAADGVEAAAPWKAFRLGRRGHPTRLECRSDGQAASFLMEHDGFRHLGLHARRKVTVDAPARCLVIDDQIFAVTRPRGAPKLHTIESRLPLEPGLAVEVRGSVVIVSDADRPFVQVAFASGGGEEVNVFVRPGAFWRRWGRSEARDVIVARCTGELPLSLRCTLSPPRSAQE